MARQFIYHMQGLSKTWPGGKKVLDNIHLSFYPDAKIGVLGVNGSGKSTLMNVLGCLDRPTSGRYVLAGQIPVRLDYGIAIDRRCRDVGLDSDQCTLDDAGNLHWSLLYAF